MRNYGYILLISMLLSLKTGAQDFIRLQLPNREQLSSERVLCVIQDSEGCLWYGTEGGGICRDNGRQVDVFRNDTSHPTLLGSNNIASLAESGHFIVIGTFHGAYVLDRRDFSVRRLQEVDDKRVDDILVTRKGGVLLTSNKKIYEYSDRLTLLNTYPSRWKGRDVYVSHLFEDRNGRIWATQWEGGLLSLKGGTFVEEPWTLDATPVDVADDIVTGGLLVGTIGKGIVRYTPKDSSDKVTPTREPEPATGNFICVDLQLSADGQWLWTTTTQGLSLIHVGQELQLADTRKLTKGNLMVLNRLSIDHHGFLLVAGNEPGPFVLTDRPQQLWYDGILREDSVCWEFRERQGIVMTAADGEKTVHAGRLLLPAVTRRTGGGIWATDGEQLYACTTDKTTAEVPLAARPAALTDDGHGNVWYSTGKEVRQIQLSSKKETDVIEVADVSALTATTDGKLWLGTIFGKLYQYDNGQLTSDSYASNESGDPINYLDTDSLGRLIIVCEHHIRLYDYKRKTLRQQSREAEGVYCIELQETRPESRWSQPEEEVLERLPRWLTSWWMICIYLVLTAGLIALITNYCLLRRQRARFMQQIKAEDLKTADRETENQKPEAQKPANDEAWLQSAMVQVEAHLSDEHYSVEQLSSDLCMSRMTFYRKIQTATGQKPTEFMRTIRLRHAAKLLRENKLTVTEISYATGFSSVSYFSRCFRNMYGVSPSQYIVQ